MTQLDTISRILTARIISRNPIGKALAICIAAGTDGAASGEVGCCTAGAGAGAAAGGGVAATGVATGFGAGVALAGAGAAAAEAETAAAAVTAGAATVLAARGDGFGAAKRA